jgi:hypothetical protein
LNHTVKELALLIRETLRDPEIAIPAPYPRNERFRTSAEYAACCRRVAEALARAMGDEA